MAVSGTTGPIVVYGQNPAVPGINYQPDYNSDIGPSVFYGGVALLDPRVGYRAELMSRATAINGGQAACGFWYSPDVLAIDQVPATLNAANIVTSAAAASATLTLVTTSALGITVATSATTYSQSGVVLPAGSVFIDAVPTMINYGPTGAVGVIDPRTMIGRAVSVTAAAGATATTATVRGYDIYGYPLTEIITVSVGGTASGKKGFKAISSVTLNAADAGHAYSVGTLDVFEFPLAMYFFYQVAIYWNNAFITATTGFLAPDTTTATGTTGSVRGTYAVQSASDGTKRLQVICSPAPYNISNANGTASLFGVTQYAG